MYKVWVGVVMVGVWRLGRNNMAEVGGWNLG